MTTYITRQRPDETAIQYADPTRFIPISPLPRPESTAVIYLQPDLATAPTLPRREGIVMPELPAVDLTRTEHIPLIGVFGDGEAPDAYVGRHRAPDDEPAVGGWRSVLATAIARIWEAAR